jgi:hypothetical protein
VVGVVECGLFIQIAHAIFVADASGVHRLDRPTRRVAPSV